MKDERILFLRKLLDELVASLEATVRVARLQGVESVPAPLQESAMKLVDRLGAASRVAAGKFVVPPAATAKVEAMCSAVQRLDAAYVRYRRALETAPTKVDEAALALESDVADVRADAEAWAS